MADAVVPAAPLAGVIDLFLVGTRRSLPQPKVPIETFGNRIALGRTIDSIGPHMTGMPNMDLSDGSQ